MIFQIPLNPPLRKGEVLVDVPPDERLRPKKDGSLIIFKGIPISQCHQCGEQYIPGKWTEKMGGLMRKEGTLIPREILSVPVIALS